MTDTKNKFSEAYRKNVEKMQIAKVSAEMAKKRGDKALSKKYRREYLDLKAEIDMHCIKIIINQ